jgi:serine/threonine protein kinase
LNRFEQEAQAAGALNHPNILVIHHIGNQNGAPYIVSELLEGETLCERTAGTALPQRKDLDYALQIAKGLAAAHEKGIVHRDIKPDNIFITDDTMNAILREDPPDLAERTPRTPLFSVNPSFDDLRDDPRFQDLLHRVALAKRD